MKRLSTYIQLRKEHGLWYAYFRGTNNRIGFKSGDKVKGFDKQNDLRRFLLSTSTPLEHGVVIDSVPTEAEKVKLEGRF